MDRPDIVARVFHGHIKELMQDLRNKIFGPYEGHVYTIEYQKRGFLHMLLILFLKKSADFSNSQLINQVVCAELSVCKIDPTRNLLQAVIE